MKWKSSLITESSRYDGTQFCLTNLKRNQVNPSEINTTRDNRTHRFFKISPLLLKSPNLHFINQRKIWVWKGLRIQWRKLSIRSSKRRIQILKNQFALDLKILSQCPLSQMMKNSPLRIPKRILSFPRSRFQRINALPLLRWDSVRIPFDKRSKITGLLMMI